MKNYKIILLISLSFTFNSCELEESPIFLDKDAVYGNLNVARSALDGIYQGLTSYGGQEQRLFVVNGYSGFFNTGKNGNSNKNINNSNLFSLSPNYDKDSSDMWQALYNTIGRCNGAIENIAVTDTDSGFNDILGQAYFVRAWTYFSLVRLFGDIPLWITLPDSENLNLGKSTSRDVYSQIISDAEMALSLMNGQLQGSGYPRQYAANMLLAKVYMTLATNPTLQASGMSEVQYWQKAYNEARKVYGQYSLVSDYTSLFTNEARNTSESIFELQISEAAANSQMGRNFSPWKWKKGQCFGWFKVHADVYDDHAATYPGDPRIIGTYLYEYSRADNGNSAKFYPANPSRSKYFNAHPFFFKYANKDTNSSTQYGNQNLIIYRYADLLIMLAEISNELQNGEQLGYVAEVLNRAGMSPHSGFTGSKEDFRDAVMREYRYELLGEGEDSHNNRRRGHLYFMTNVIDVHNNAPNLKNNVDLILNSDPLKVMLLPIPLVEINTNELID
jgi:hypothetical protein